MRAVAPDGGSRRGLSGREVLPVDEGAQKPDSSLRVLGDFELRREIGRGGMGTVYEAWQRSLQRTVAVKILGQHVSASPKAVTRFQREAQAAAQLHHPNIVPIFSLGEADGVYYYAMELIDGPGLNAVIADRRGECADHPSAVSAAETVAVRSAGTSGSMASDTAETQPLPSRSGAGDSTVVLQSESQRRAFDAHCITVATHMASVADALAYAHERGIVHRDIKPHNLLFGSDKKLRVADFGLARLAEQPGVTVTGEMIGSPLYMSPEQIRGDTGRIDHRTDIYSLGATMYEWLTLSPPYPGDTREQVISRILTTEVCPPRSLNPLIPIDLETVCLRAVDQDVSRRYQSAGELRDELRRFIEKRPIRARRDGLVSRARKYVGRHQLAAVGVAAVLVAVVLGWQLASKQQKLEDQTAVAQQAVQETERLRDVLSMLPVEIAATLKLAEAAIPLLDEVVSGVADERTSAAVPTATGPQPNAVGTPEGITRRAVRDYYEAHAPAPWQTNVSATSGELSGALAEALSFWVNRPDAALERVTSVLQENPNDIEARTLDTALHGRLGQFEEMLADAQELVRLQPRSAQAFVWRGLAHLLLKHSAASLDDLGRAVQLSGFSKWSQALHGLALVQAEQVFVALSLFDGALAEDPELAVALLGRAAARYSLGNLTGAVADLTDLLELDPDNADVLALRGNRYVYLSDFAAAEKDYERAIKIAGSNTAIQARLIYSRFQAQRQSQPGGGVPETGSASEIGNTTDVGAGADSSAVDRPGLGARPGALSDLLPPSQPSANPLHSGAQGPQHRRSFLVRWPVIVRN